MKQNLLLLFALFTLCTAAKAAPGDTTWVHANNFQLGGYGSYDSTVFFPHTTTYRRIYMIFTLGKYTCPTGSTWCGDWDYTVQNYLIKPSGETFELGRLITPYANAGAPRTPWTWTQHYIYDVTDYAAKLQDSCKIRIFYSGYSGGFTSDIKFALIEGTPDRNVLDIKRLWGGSFSYGDTTHSDSFNINTHFAPVSLTAPAGTQVVDLKFTATGHGSDANYCSEFCSTNYQVKVNGTAVATRRIWRDNCGKNQLWPQSGTWLYDRANWCPGAMVYPHQTTLTGVTGGTTFNTSLQFDSYVSTGGASYTTEGTLIYYGPMNKTLDATVEDIIAPTTDENHFRENPACGKPTIHVKNTGATTITTIDINYGVVGIMGGMYTWNGSLPSLAETDIVLPEIADLNTVSGTTTALTFKVNLALVNGTDDADSTNNTLTSQFMPSPLLPSILRLQLRTNNETLASSSTLSETSWTLYNMSDAVVASRTNAAISTYYNDTVSLSPGCYKLVIADSSCNGLYWWANPSTVTGGSFSLRKLNGTVITMHGYATGGTYGNDFGCNYTYYFYTNWPLGVNDITADPVNIDVFPNPAQNLLNIDIQGIPSVNGTIKIMDALGRVVMEQPCSSAHPQINTTSLSNGVYTVLYIDGASSSNRLQTRMIIAK